jgi:hypothetical protein
MYKHAVLPGPPKKGWCVLTALHLIKPMEFSPKHSLSCHMKTLIQTDLVKDVQATSSLTKWVSFRPAYFIHTIQFSPIWSILIYFRSNKSNPCQTSSLQNVIISRSIWHGQVQVAKYQNLPGMLYAGAQCCHVLHCFRAAEQLCGSWAEDDSSRPNKDTSRKLCVSFQKQGWCHVRTHYVSE